MKQTKHILATLAMLLCSLTASAEAVQIDGIWYNLVSKIKQAEVTKPTDGTKYSGAIVIPATVNYNDVEYSVTSIGEYAFYNCSSLTAITIPEGVRSIGEYAFYKCNSLTSITIPKGVTSLEDFAFQYCTNLTSITLPEGLTTIDLAAISHCDSLKTITIPASVTKLGDYAFDYTGFTDVLIPENSQLESIGDYAFSYCNNLNSITIPSSVSRIGDRTFSGCSSLTSITLPEGVTSIGGSAFSDCSSLTSIVLPNNIRTIGSKAFANCSDLLDVYCYAESVPSAYSDAFDGSYPEYITLHVPSNALESYKTTAPWSSFGTITALKGAVAITLSQSSATLHEGKSLTLGATVSPDDADDKTMTWSSSDESIATVDGEGKVTAIVVGNATITATAKDGSGVTASCEVTVVPAVYAITFLIDGEVVATDTLTRGSTITLPEAPAKEGYTFSGWGEVPETMPAEDVTVSGVFVANKYLVTFKVDGEVVASDSLEYNSAIVVPEAPVKEGHTFSGWSGVAETVPAHDVIYEGGYTINSYLLTYLVDGETLLSMPVVYGGGIPTLNVPAKEGYTFSGWGEVPETMPAEDVTVSGVFAKLPSICLTISQADNGCVKQHLTVGSVCTYTIEAAEGWKIHTVTLNGEDVTSQLTEEGTFTTPALQEDAVLNISYEQLDGNEVKSVRANAIKVSGYEGIITVDGCAEGEGITIYTTDGAMVAQQTAESASTRITVATGQMYIVKVADKVVKILM